MDGKKFLRSQVYRAVPDQEADDHPAYFALRGSNNLCIEDFGVPIFATATSRAKVKGYVPRIEDQRVLTIKEQSWLLVDIPDIPDYVNFAWARTLEWERHAQIRSDGYFSPPNFIPKYPEPKKWYKRRPEQEYTDSSIHPANCLQLRILVRLSDALSEAAMDTTQDWFMIALTIDPDAPSDTVGDLLAFVIKIVGIERLRPGQLAISACLSNPRLWKNSTPLLTLSPKRRGFSWALFVRLFYRFHLFARRRST